MKNRDRYPENWDLISEGVKALAGYKCENCKSPSRPGRILTVHHVDGDTTRNTHDNLVALCQVCHLKFQRRSDRHNTRQLSLFGDKPKAWMRRVQISLERRRS